MAMQKRFLDRNINLFRDYLELGSFREAGKKNNVTEGIARDASHGVWGAILRMVRQKRLQLPKSEKCRDVLKEKEYWTQMLQTFVTYIGK